jgi:dTDP-glucose 4,6-dehydratase
MMIFNVDFHYFKVKVKEIMVNLTNSKVLVTGGGGFIGSNFIKMLLEKYNGIKIINFDKGGIGSRSLKSEIPATNWNTWSYLELNNDIRNIDKIHFQDYKFDYIFHFAAESHVDRSISGPSPFIENNVMGMVSLLEWVRQHQPQARVINISTDEVYGHLEKYEAPFIETCKFDPRSPYAASKASADLIANSYVTTYGLDIITTHCCNNFGKHQADEKFIPTVIRNMVQGNKIPVYGTGENIREWIHVDDHNKSILEITEGGRAGYRYNIGSKVEKTNLEMIVDISEILGKVADIEYVEDRKGHDFRYAIDSLNYRRQFELRDHSDALRETVEFYKEKYGQRTN